MGLASAFRTFMVLGIGLSLAGAAMHLFDHPSPSVALTTSEASAPTAVAGMQNSTRTPVVTGSPPAGTQVAPQSEMSVEVAPATAVATAVTTSEAGPAAEPAEQLAATESAASVASLPSGVGVAIVGVYSPEKASALISSMNVARVEAGLHILSTDSLLAEVAGVRAEDLAEHDYFDHYSPDGLSAFSELSARGVRYGLAGENLARNNYPEPESLKIAFDALMASPGHRANILEPRFSRVGVAALLDGDLWIYVTVFMD